MVSDSPDLSRDAQLLDLFEKSIGYEFKIIGQPLFDVVTGVDKEYKLVKGKTYGDFHVSLCELTGVVESENSK